MKTKKIIIYIFIPLIVVLSIVGYVVFSGKDAVTYRTTKVMKDNIVQTVSETGTVKSENEVELSFLTSGKVEKINYQIGQNVKTGDILAVLDISSLETKKQEAKANLDVAMENLNKLLSGATSEEIAVAQATVSQSQVAYEAAKTDMIKAKNVVDENIQQAQKTLNDLEEDSIYNITTYEQAISSAKTTLENTIDTYQSAIDSSFDKALIVLDDCLAKANTALDAINRVLTDQYGKDYLSAKNTSYLENTKKSYNSAVSKLNKAKARLLTTKTDNTTDSILISLDQEISALNAAFLSMQDCFQALENSLVSSSFTQTIIDAHKTSISSNLTIIGNSLTSLQTAKQNLRDALLNYDTKVSASQDSLDAAQAAYDSTIITARNALSSAKITGDQTIASAQSKIDSTYEAWKLAISQLEKITAAPNKYDVNLAQAKIRQAQSSLDTILNQIDNNILKAPIDGTITKIEFDVGEQVSASIPVINILSVSNFEIEVLISETDIEKINLGNVAEITLDSFGDDVKFAGKVAFIEPAETVIQDVIYYKVLINFNSENSKIKSGMTANVIITTAHKDNVLVVPLRAIIERNGDGKIIRILGENNQVEERKISVGLRGDGGIVEIIKGAIENESVITSIIE